MGNPSSNYIPQQNTSPNPLGWGGPGMRYGSTDPMQNMQYAQQNLPGASYAQQNTAQALYGTPWSSNPAQYGRWNWAGGGQAQPQQPGSPAPYQPPPTGSGTVTPPPTPGGTTSGAGGSNGTATGGGSPTGLFGMTQDQQQGTAYNPGVSKTGDIFSNPAFANYAATTGAGGLFGNATPWTLQGMARGGGGGNADPAQRAAQLQALQSQLGTGVGSPAWWSAAKASGG